MDSCIRENGFVVAVNTVKASIADVQTVAQNIADVNTVADNIADVNTVAQNIADVNTVAGNIADVNTVALNILDVNVVLDNIADVNNVSLHMTDVIAAVPAAQTAVDALAAVQIVKQSVENTAIEVALDAANVSSTVDRVLALESIYWIDTNVNADAELLLTYNETSAISNILINPDGELIIQYI